MNSVCLVGNIASDISSRTIQTRGGDLDIADFTLAVEDPGNSEKTYFPRVTAFGGNAKFATKYLKKGRRVSVEGYITTSRYTNKNGDTVYETKVTVKRLQAEDMKKPTENVAYEMEVDEPVPQTPAVEEADPDEF